MRRVRDLTWRQVLFAGVWGYPWAEIFLAFAAEKPLRLRHSRQVWGSMGRAPTEVSASSGLLGEEARLRGSGRAD